MFRSQQYILFSYYARGINFNDLCKLQRKRHIIGDSIDYTRSKTDKQFQFELHPKALKIASLFRMYPLQSDNDHVFPILMKCHDTPRKIDQRVESALKDVNEDLKEFGKMIKFNGSLTSYVFRHSFATHLEQAGVDIRYIKEALGHETEEQTRVYLSEISDWRVANAVKKAIK
jgi:integrase